MARRLAGAVLALAVLTALACSGGGSAPAAKTSSAPTATSSGSAPTAGTVPPASVSTAAQPSAAVKVRGAWVAETANQMIWPVAKDAGYFDKYGVDFDLSYVSGSLTSVAAIVGGDLDMTNVAGSAVVSAQAEGTDLVMVAGFLNQAIFRVMATPDIQRLEDLKGKTIAVTRVGNADYFAWQTILEHLGWSMDDVRFVAAQNAPGQVALLSNGGAQAIAVSPPNDVLAEQIGAHQVLDTVTLHEPEQNNGIAVTRQYLNEHRDAVKRVIQASIEAMARWKQDPTFVKGVIKKYLQQDQQRFIDVGYEAYAPVWPEAPYPTREGMLKVIQQVATQNPKAAGLNVDQMIDTSLVKELEDSGFIRQVYGH
ncbi:MAG TPA: ABC transporter substrate-binding protein [Chloroflexota bacterium]|nr:ABC transporter substrate-binding protein [Chloroflexota bacterium]